MRSDLIPEPTLIMAPIRGITDVVYRNAFARWFGGFDRAIAPFIQPRRGQALRPGELRKLAPDANNALWTIPQVMTNDAQTFARALFELHDAGHVEVNWNLGCPSPTVAGRGRGSGLLPHPGHIDEILTHVLKVTPVQLSVKIRLGYHDPDEHLAVLEVLNRHPLTEVILHARTGDQMYWGVSDVDRAGRALARCRHPFAYNGDINDLEGFRKVRQLLPGAAGWMIGRGALMCPFLPALIKEDHACQVAGSGPPASPDAGVRCQRLRGFHDQLVNGYSQWLSGPGHLLDRMKEQWTYLAHSFANPRQVISQINRCAHVGAYTHAVDRVLDQPLLMPTPTDQTRI